LKRALAILFTVSASAVGAFAQSPGSPDVVSSSDSTSHTDDNYYWTRLKPALPRIVTNFGISSLARWGIVDLMKSNIHEMRPDRSANNSMPSRHAVWAYGLATTGACYLIPYSPFWGVGLHTVAAGIGFERMIDNRHYAGDVLAGAGIGIGTSILSDQISRLIFNSPRRYTFPKKVKSRLSLSFSTGASFPLEKEYGGIILGTSLISQLRFAAKVDDLWDLSGFVFMQTAPLKQNYYYLGTLTHIGAGAGGSYHCPIARTPLEFTASAGVGLKYAFAPKHIDVRRFSPYGEVDARIDLHLTERFTLGAQVGFSLSSLAISPEDLPYRSNTLPAIKCSLITIAHF